MKKYLLFLLLLIPGFLFPQVETLTFGTNANSWRARAESIVALDEFSYPGSLQPQQLHPDQNILLGKRNERNEPTILFGSVWSLEKVPKEGLELGINPRYWNGLLGAIRKGPQELIDGDPNTVSKVIHVFKGITGGFSPNDLFTWDFGFPIPINRIVFFPPDNGIDELGGLRKQRFPRAYEVSAQLAPKDYLLVGPETTIHTLDTVIERTFFNDKRVVDIRFETDLYRFLRLRFNIIDQLYLLGEIQIYGEGYLPVSRYRSVVIDMGKPVNFGNIHWEFQKFHQANQQDQPILSPELPIKLEIQTRTGRDSSPNRYTVLTEFDSEREVDEASYRKASPSSLRIGPRPGDQASIEPDIENWSPWSTAYDFSNQEIRSTDSRRYLQLRFDITSDDFRSFGRIDSIGIEYSPLLVESMVAEISLEDAADSIGPLEVPAGIDTNFVYNIRATFGPEGRIGFDAIRLKTFANVEFNRLEWGAEQQEIIPDSINIGTGELTVYFPSTKIVRSSGEELIKLHFRTSLLGFGTQFLGEVFEVNGTNLAQSIEPGDATPAFDNDDIQVFASGEKLSVLSNFSLSGPVITPNGDGINEIVQIDLTLLAIDQVDTEIGVFDLSGRLVRTLSTAKRQRGTQFEQWDGRDNYHALVPPGLYLIRVFIDADKEQIEQVRSLVVAY